MTDHRAAAERTLDDEGRVAMPSGTRVDLGVLRALLAIHDLLDERLPDDSSEDVPEPTAHEWRASAAHALQRAADLDGTSGPLDYSAPDRAPESDPDGIDPDSITEWTWCLVRTSDGYDRLQQVKGGQMREGPGGSASPFPDYWTIVTDDVRIGKGGAS